MKKLLVFTSVLCTCYLLCACSQNNNVNNQQESVTTQEVEENVIEPVIDEEISQESGNTEEIENVDMSQLVHDKLLDYGLNTLNIKQSDVENQLVDLDGDRLVELVCISDSYGEKNISIYSVIEDQIRVDDELEGYPYGSITSFEIRKDTEKDKVFVTIFNADGVCYTDNRLYELDYSKGVASYKLLAYFTCDQEAEEQKREDIRKQYGISKNSTNISEEVQLKLENVHTTKYVVDDKVCSEQEYMNYIKSINNKELIKKLK